MQNNENKSNELENQIENASQFEKESNDEQSNKKIKSKYLNEKTVTIVLTLAVALIAVVFLFIRSNNTVGAKTSQEAAQGFVEAVNSDDYEKASNYVYYENDDIRKDVKKELKDKDKIQTSLHRHMYKTYKDYKIVSVDELGDEARVTLKHESEPGKIVYSDFKMKKVDDRWYCDIM